MNYKQKATAIFAYLYKTLFLALGITGIVLFVVGNGSWMNYIIITFISMLTYWVGASLMHRFKKHN